MLRRLWLLFAQATTVGLALLFIVTTLKPEWLKRGPAVLSTPVSSEVSIRQVAPPAGAPRTPAASYAEAAQRAMPAVVSVYTTKEIRRGPYSEDPFFERFFGERFRQQAERVTSLGSGVIATADGYVLTNNHVVQAADEILVALGDGRRVEAKLVGADPETDLAVLRIEAPDLPVITFGRSEDLRVGDVVLAIGNPFNVGQTVTMGIVSALGRTGLDLSRYESYIQTDAAINQGNSGGALVDTQGNLVGINTAIFSRSGGSIGIGFAIPTTIITQVMEQLIKTGKVVRGYFGIEPEDITPEMVDALKLPRKDGVIVRGVQRSAPAGKAGLEPGDILLSINDQPVQDTPRMLTQIAQLAPGSVARVKVIRGGKELEIAVTVGERPVPQR
ncbi:Do family serine endopeptidase [Betaproteobacteria bacterium PRO7]|jgi:serine protease DegQ|nr:Do family serine endopeptidase [Burkholderiaceae bacterium]MDL1862789.1 Do family serine endopeptidase [Betaproteobacteria bacterium PRO7]GIL04114.1 MAG: DegQ protease [Betaproteobacteria bacterium]